MTKPRERPILFSGPMVKAILEGRCRIVLDEHRVAAMFTDGLTTKEIAAHFGCSVTPVKRVLKALDLRRAAKRRPGVGSGSDNPAWKGGRRIRPDGYVEIWTTDGHRLEHRVVMATHLGRPLGAHEVIHHRDGDKANNAIGNLELMTQSEHVRHHITDMHAARYGK